jgi:hypothetical protein
MTNATTKLAVAALQDQLGIISDNLARAKMILVPGKGDEPYGYSPQTLNQIIAAYEEREREFRSAIKELQGAQP